MLQSTTRIESFVLSFFELLGARIEEPAPRLWRIELARDLAAELEGTPRYWTTPFGSGEGGHATYYFTFDPAVAQAHADAELISAGSHRFEQVIEAVRRTTRAFRVWLPARACPQRPGRLPGPVAYRPFYLFCLRLTLKGINTRTHVFHAAVDRVDEIALCRLAEALPRLPLQGGLPTGGDGAEVEPPALSFERAFALAYEELLGQLERSDPAWARVCAERLRAEKERLAAFYDELARDGEQVEEERERRLAELDETAPRVLVEIQGAGEAYLPVAYGDGQVHHLAFELLR